MSDPQVRHLRSLTSMRFGAASMVMLHHLVLAAPALGGLAVLTQAGYVGVTFFFVLSGFVLTHAWNGDDRPSRFYRRRFARIYPVHVLTVMMIVSGVVWRPYWPALPANLTLTQTWSPDDRVSLSFVGAAWSLSCEVFFYALFPVLVVWLTRRRRPLGLAVAMSAAMLGLGLASTAVWPALGAYLYHFPPFRLLDFTIGIVLCLAVRRGWRPGLSPLSAALLVAIAYVAVSSTQILTGSGIGQAWLYSALMTLPFGLLIATLAAADMDGHASFVAQERWVRLGQWSFALYMVHGPVLGLAHGALDGVTGWAAYLVGVAVSGMTIVLAGLVYRFYERPLERLLRGPRRSADARRAGSYAAPLGFRHRLIAASEGQRRYSS